jgi:hypothetical protein
LAEDFLRLLRLRKIPEEMVASEAVSAKKKEK